MTLIQSETELRKYRAQVVDNLLSALSTVCMPALPTTRPLNTLRSGFGPACLSRSACEGDGAPAERRFAGRPAAPGKKST